MKMTAEQRTHMMLNAPVSSLIARLAVPSIVSMLISSIYNMADTFFVSQLGTSASGAVGVIFSAMSILQAISFTIGMGTGANVSRCLGARQDDEARTFCSVGVITAFMTGILICMLGITNLDWLVRFLGSTETIAPYAKDYATYIFYAAPFMMASFAMNNVLRFQGLATYGMVGITTGGILNMVLDPILIFGLNLGTAGAAIATAISQMVSFFILLGMCNLKSDAITIRLRSFRPTLKMYLSILHVGLPSLGRQGIASVSTILLNTAAGVYGDAAIAALSIVSRFVMFINSAVIGFGQGFQPVCGFNYGAGKYSRVREAYRFSVKIATIILVCLVAIALPFSRAIVAVFRADDPEVIRIGTLSMQLQLFTLPLWGVIVMSNMFTQSIGYGGRATLLSASRQGICLIPLLLTLPGLFGLIGLQICQPIADILTFFLALFIAGSVLKKMKTLPDKA